MEAIEILLNELTELEDSDQAVQEKLTEIKKHLIQFAQSSKNVLESKEFFKNANS